MKLFRTKKTKIIRIRTVKKELYELSDRFFAGGGDEKVTKYVVTQVLCMVGDQLVVKEFNGKWDMADMKVLEKQ